MSTHTSYKTVAIAGTFDHLHAGHKAFIQLAFETGQNVIIGLTSNEYVSEKLKFQPSKFNVRVKSFQERKEELEEFLKEKEWFERGQVVEIHDVYGPGIEKNDIQALIVTEESRGGGNIVNQKRQELGFSPLDIIEIPLVMAEDSKPIASTRIRLGEIDRSGKRYKNICVFEEGIAEDLRITLKVPQGQLIAGNPNNPTLIGETIKSSIQQSEVLMVITVGDEVTKLINQLGIKAQISIFDFKVNRKEKYHSLEDLGYEQNQTTHLYRTVKNPPGAITSALVENIHTAIKESIHTGKNSIIQIDGEDDLAGVPAILLAPLGSIVLYGQPGEGIVLVAVSEQTKLQLSQKLIHQKSAK